MLEHLDRCQLVKASGEETSSLSIIRNGEIVYQQDNSWLSSIKAVLRYGLWSLARMEYFVGNLLSNFAEIYPKLNAGDAFSSVTDLLDGMSPVSRNGEVSHEMLELTRVSLKEKMKHLSMSDLLIEEIGTVATKVNYGQFPGMHSFVGSVSLAGIQGGLWRVQGGNYKIPECLISKSGAKLIKAKVNTVEKLGGVYNLGYTTEMRTETAEFDIVVLALPLTQDTKSLQLVGVPEAKTFPGKYQRTLAYIVQGSLNYTALGVTVDWAQTENFFFVDAAEPIASIGRLTPVDYNPDSDKDMATVYKIFSRSDLSKSEIGKYFSSEISVNTLDWLAYPDYTTYPGLSSFQLEDDLYYLNNIEWAASAMEMSALSARNIVNIIKSRQSELKNPENTSQKSTLQKSTSQVDPKAEL